MTTTLERPAGDNQLHSYDHLPVVVGVSGRKRAGKDTLASILTERVGYVRVAFADPLRDVLWDTNPTLFGIDGRSARADQLLAETGGYEQLKEDPNWGQDLRGLLQRLGVAARTHLGADVWVDAALTKIDTHVAAGRRVIVTDMRFPNEVEAIRARGGLIIRVNRSTLDIDPANAADAHVSETLLDDMSLLKPSIVLNSDPFDTFEQRVLTAFSLS